jgi:hypothetical protein
MFPFLTLQQLQVSGLPHPLQPLNTWVWCVLWCLVYWTKNRFWFLLWVVPHFVNIFAGCYWTYDTEWVCRMQFTFLSLFPPILSLRCPTDTCLSLKHMLHTWKHLLNFVLAWFSNVRISPLGRHLDPYTDITSSTCLSAWCTVEPQFTNLIRSWRPFVNWNVRKPKLFFP